MIYESLRKDLNEARRAKDSTKVLMLSTVLGEIASGAKMVDGAKLIDDNLSTAVLKKTIKGLDELLTFGENEKASTEKALLEAYLPTQMSTADLSVAIAQAVTDGASDMKGIMAYLKANHLGLYDGKMASQLATIALGK